MPIRFGYGPATDSSDAPSGDEVLRLEAPADVVASSSPETVGVNGVRVLVPGLD